MPPAIDEDVKVWVAAKTIALDTPEFSLQSLLEQMKKQFRSDPKKVERFVTRHCVANAAGDGDPYYNYLFRLSPSKYRLFHAGDPVEYSHASAPTTPEVRRVPPEFKSLYSSSARLAQHMRAVPTTSANATPVLRLEPLQQKTKSAVPKAAGKTSGKPLPLAPATSGLKPLLSDLDDSVPANAARRNLLDQLFLEMGTIGSRLEHARGSTFSLNVPGVTGSATSLQNLAVRLPNGGSISHVADVIVEIEGPSPRTLYVDIVESTARPDEWKARSFDALHLRQEKKDRYGILVFVSVPHAGLLREQAEAIAYPYDHIFGIEADDVKSPNKFYALKQHITDWVHGKGKPQRA